METKEINKEDVIVLTKLGIDVKDIANTYLDITDEKVDIPKEVYIKQLTDILKYFQSRNNNIDDGNSDAAIYKEDVLNMIKTNKKLFRLDINKKIKPMCEKFDSYYFMNTEYTNRLIKKNPNIFNLSNIDLEKYSIILSNFAVKVDGKIVNLFEYVIKQNSSFLAEDVQKTYEKLMNLKEHKNSNLFTENEILDIQNNNLNFDLKEYKLPLYNKENIAEYKEKILKLMEN